MEKTRKKGWKKKTAEEWKSEKRKKPERYKQVNLKQPA